MRISERLNLVFPIFGDAPATKDAEGKEVEAPPIAYVHSMPIRREVFEANYLLLSKTMTAILTEGLREIQGPKVAALILNSIAKDLAGERGDAEKVKAPLLAEIHRLSNVIVGGPNGWDSMPFDDAVSQNLISEDDLAEVVNAVVFFIVASATLPRREVPAMITGAAKLWRADVSFLNVTEFIASLRTSTTAGTSAQRSIQVTTGVQQATNVRQMAVVETGDARKVASRLPV